MPSNQLYDLSATTLLAAYRSGSLSPVEVTQSVIEQIQRCEPFIRATYRFDPEGALQAAKASEVRWRQGSPQTCGGVTLDGIPTTIKENIATKGDPIPLGTAATELVPASEDAPISTRLREAGAVILGKTTMPEYGCMSSGLSSLHPLTRNPWNTKMNPGGSSAGAGAAGAAGYGPLHVGTDIGGSVRFPSAWCGLVGLKPSLGRVAIDPPYMGRAAGSMTRTVTDAALLMSVISQPDPQERDSMNLPTQSIDWTDLETNLKGKRLGLLLDAGCGMPMDPQVAKAVKAAAELFEQAGAIVETMHPWMDDEMLHGLDLFWRLRAAADVERLSPQQRACLLPIFVEWVNGGKGRSAEEGFSAYSQSMRIRNKTVAATKIHDYVLTPISANTSFPAEWGYANNNVALAHDQIGFTVPFNMSEQPAVSVCCGYDSNGVPIGLQIAGHRFDDLGVLRMARAWERIRPVPRPWPTPYSDA